MFLQNFLTFAAGDETPENYNVWASLSALASVVGAKVWLSNGKFRVYSNLYVLLLGPPGNAKTTAMRRAQKIISHFKDSIPLSADCQTKESICKDLAGESRPFQLGPAGDIITWTPYSMFITELSHLLGGNSMHMIDFLTTIYDTAPEAYSVKTKGKGNDYVPCPCLNLLACTTPDWIALYLKQDIISGGFTRRAIMVNEDWSVKRIPRPKGTPEQARAFATLILEAEKIFELRGELLWDPAAERAYDKWYTDLKIPADLDTRSFHRCKHNQILKIGILVALAAHPGDMTFYEEDFLTAVGLVASIEPRLGLVFRGMGRNELKSVMDKGLQILNSSPNGEIGEKVFRTAIWSMANERERDEVIRELVSSGQMYLVERTGRRFFVTHERAKELGLVSEPPPTS